MSIDGCTGARDVSYPHGEASGGPAEAQDRERSLLPPAMQALATSSDLGAQISALILELGHEQKKSAHVAREAAEQAQRAAEAKELDAMRAEADAKLAAGIAGGACKIASAGASASGIGGTEDDKQLAACFAKTYEAIGEIDQALLKHDADLHGIAAKRAGNAASRERTAIDDARDHEKEAKEAIAKALDLYKEYQAAKADAQRAAFLKA